MPSRPKTAKTGLDFDDPRTRKALARERLRRAADEQVQAEAMASIDQPGRLPLAERRLAVYTPDGPDLTDPFTKTISDGLEGLTCLLYTSPSPRDRTRSRMPSSA